MKSLFLKTTHVIALLLLLTPATAVASELRLEANRVHVRVGEELTLTAVLYAEEAVNAVEGRVSFPPDLLSVEEIRDGNSSINFWVEKPQLESPGVIVYSGITPGGFSGVNNMLFSIVFKAKGTGLAHVVPEEATILRNDGEGTKLAVNLRDVLLEIREGGDNTSEEKTEDKDAPESFVPKIARDLNIFDGKYFLVFATQDKGSGIRTFEVREGRFGRWREAESPYMLSRQKLDKDIYVRAVDHAGNERISIVPTTVHTFWWERYGLFAILIVLIILGVSYKKSWLGFVK